MLTREEIEEHLRRVEMQIELLTNGIVDRATRPEFDASDLPVLESHAQLKHFLEQKQLLENELRKLDGE